MVMQNSVMDPQDQRKSSSMEDSTAMTIEFLRARLLSERSVSRSARQRADELAEKVIELEEQLRLVILQRKMAEKATTEVLAILESQGISDVSEFDSGSDIEVPCDSGVSNDSASIKDDEKSTSSKGRRHGSAELSDSNVDSSSAPGRSLSWKGRHDSSRSLEKFKTSNVRRRSSFSSISSSPKHRLGKSCRRIKHRESRSVVEESLDKPVNVNSQTNEVVSSSEGFPNDSDAQSNILKMECKFPERDESELQLANKNNDANGEREKNMEKALEHQARLIDQYEAMEKAQREWEEKFRENNSSTPESCDLGNHSDITEERDESKAQTPCHARVVTSSAEEDRSEARGVCLSEEMLKAEGTNMPKSKDNASYENNISTTVGTSGILGQENSHSLSKGNQPESQENRHSQPSDRHHQGPYRHGSTGSKPTDCFQTDVNGSLPLEDAARNKNGIQAEKLQNRQTQPSDRHHQGPHRHDLTDSKQTDSFPTDVNGGLPLEDDARNTNGPHDLASHKQSHEFGGVLESLKQAKLSLQQEISKLPLVESRYTDKANRTLAPVSNSDDEFHVPAGFSGLFRLPTDFSAEATARFNKHDSKSGFSSNFDLGGGTSITSDGPFGTNPYSGTMLSFTPDHQSLATGYSETGSRFDTKRAPSVPFLDSGLLSSTKYIYPTHTTSSSYQNATSPMSSGEGLSRPYSSSTVGVPPAYNFSFHGDHVR